MTKKSNFFLQNLRAKYERLSTRMQNAVNDGRFQRFSQDKKRRVLQSLARYERQLQQWGIAVATSAALLFPASHVAAQTPVGNEFRVSSTTVGLQNYSRIARAANGDYVITWEDIATDGDFFGVFAQRFNSAGQPQGSEFQVANTSSGSQYTPAIDMAADGDFVISWVNVDGDGVGGDYNVYARRFASDGTPQGNEFLVNTVTVGPQRYSDIAMDDSGAFVVTFTSVDNGDYNIYARRFDNGGQPSGAEFLVNSITTEGQYDTKTAMDSDGDFVVTWQSYHTPEAAVFARRYNNAGEAQGPEFQVNTYSDYYVGYQNIAMDDDGDFVITWLSYYQDSAYKGIYAQRYNNAGVAQGGEIHVNTNSQYYHADPSVALDNNGDFVIAWADYGLDGSYYGIYAQVYNNAGQAQGNNFLVNSTTSNYQSSPDVAMDSNGDFVITWSSYEQDGDSYGIYAQSFALAAGGVCDIPQGLSTDNITNNSAKLNWEATPGAIKYKIQLQNIPTGVQTTIVAGPNDINAIAASLSSDTRYRWFIKAKCPTGWTAASPWQVFRTNGAFLLENESIDLNGDSANGESIFQNDGRLGLQPNPANEMVKITSFDQPFQVIRVTDATGRVVMEKTGLNTSQLEIDVRDLANGLYHLQAQSGDESQVLPLVIMK